MTVSTTPGLLARIAEHASDKPAHPAFTFLGDGEQELGTLDFAELDRLVRTVADALRSRLTAGDRVLLLVPKEQDFVPIFLGCLSAGVIPVPAYSPFPTQTAQRLDTLRAIACDCGPVAVVCSADEESNAAIRTAVPALAGAVWLRPEELAADSAHDWNHVPPAEGDVAFLQYTSGSTGDPKGVMVTHGALLHNEEMIRTSMRHDEDMVLVGWLPLFHDMGLIGNVLQTAYVGGHGVLMSPSSFIKRPIRWLQAISRYRAHTSGAPNFAYDLCARRIRTEECTELDLSNWRVAYNGAEPVRPSTLDEFTKKFSPWGFRYSSWFPCYGLAESTLIVSGCRFEEEPPVLTIDAEALRSGRVVEAEDGRAGQRLVGSGISRMDRRIVIADPDTGETGAPGRVGEIWIGGADVAAGYWERTEETERTFGAHLADTGEGPFLRSGDLGFVRDGELYVTGRHKDVIIVDGRNHYPQDIEATVEHAVPGIRSGGVVAFSADDGTTERVVVLAATGKAAAEGASEPEIVRAVRGAVAEAHGITVDEVVLVGPGAVLKTSSGKVRRSACRTAHQAGNYVGLLTRET